MKKKNYEQPKVKVALMNRLSLLSGSTIDTQQLDYDEINLDDDFE